MLAYLTVNRTPQVESTTLTTTSVPALRSRRQNIAQKRRSSNAIYIIILALLLLLFTLLLGKIDSNYCYLHLLPAAEALTPLVPTSGYQCSGVSCAAPETAFQIRTTEGGASPHVVTFHSGFVLLGSSVEVGNALPYTALTPSIHLIMSDGEFTTNNDYNLPGLSITINAGLAPNSIIYITNVSFTASDITRMGVTSGTYNSIFRILEGVVAPNISISIVDNKIFSQTNVTTSDFGATISTSFMWITGNMSLVGGSTMIVANNTGRILNEGHGAHNINTHFIAYENCNCTFSGSSGFEITNNSISGIEAVTSLAQGNAQFMYRSKCPWFISGNSFVLITGNTLPNITTINNNHNVNNASLIDDKNMESMANLVFGLESPTTIDDNSAWVIANNVVGLAFIMQYPLEMGIVRLSGRAEDNKQTFKGYVVLVSFEYGGISLLNNAEWNISSNDITCTNVRRFGADTMTANQLFGETESSILSLKNLKMIVSGNSKLLVDNTSMFAQFEFISASIMRSITMVQVTSTWQDTSVFSFSSNNITFETRLNHNIQQRVFNLDQTTFDVSAGSSFISSDCRLDMIAVEGVMAINTAHVLLIADAAIRISGSTSTLLVERNYLQTNISAATDPAMRNITSIITIQLVSASTRSIIGANNQGVIQMNHT